MSLSPIRALTLEVPESIDLRQAARYLGAPGEPDSGTLALLERCAPPLLHAAMPKAVWRTADTAAWDEAGILQGADIRRHLTECPQAILLAVTLGPMVDSQIRRSAVGDVAAGAAADALASALAVSFVGIISFVGLVAPHIMRRFAGDESRFLLPASALGGASLLTLCDLAARMLFTPYELPVGILLSLFGGPFFIWLLFRQRKGRSHD